MALFVATPLIAFRQQLWSQYLGSKLEVYSSVPTVMVLLLVRYWIECPISCLGMAAYATDRLRTLSLQVIGWSISNVVITIYFVYFRHMGAIGSALGTLISVLLWYPLVTKFGLDLLGLKFAPWFRAAVWRGIVPSIVAGSFAWGWNHWMQPESIPELLFATAIVGAVYILAILLFCLDEEENRQLRYLFAKLSWQKAL
jgi:hypothetical protein